MQLDLAGGPTIEVIGDPQAETWLHELLAAALGPTAPDAPTWRLEVRASARELAALRAGRPATVVERPMFSVEHESLSLPGWEADGVHVLDDERRGCAIRIDGPSVTLIGDPTRRRWRFAMALLAYELIALTMRRSWVELHAASVVVDRRAVLVSGPKGAGKTTLAMAMTRAGGGLLANDRTFVRADGVVGLPTPVKLLPGTAAAIPELDRAIIPHRGYLHTVAELPGVTTPREEDEPRWLSPTEANRRLDATAVSGEHPAGLILFPVVDASFEGVEVTEVPTAEAGSLLVRNLYRTDAASRAATLIEDLAGGPPPVRVDLVDQIAATVPVRRVRLGRAALDDPGLLDALEGARWR